MDEVTLKKLEDEVSEPDMNMVEMILKILEAVESGNDMGFLPDPAFTNEEHEEALIVFRMKKRAEKGRSDPALILFDPIYCIGPHGQRLTLFHVAPR